MGKDIEQAICTITKAIKEDEEYRKGWQANIAMAFKDSFLNYKSNHKVSYINNKDLHIIANEAAINFLKLLTK